MKSKKLFATMFVIIFCALFVMSRSYVVKGDTVNDVGISYQGQIQDIGWQNSVSDGQEAGTNGQSLRLETVKIHLNNALQGMYVTYQTHVQNIGWMSEVGESQVAGTVGKGLRVESIKIQLHNASNYHVQYQVHVQNIGWMDWVQDGQEAGTTGRSLRIEAIRIRVVKDNSVQPTFNTVYQANVQSLGWQSWVDSSNIAGTIGQGLRIEALKINVQNLQAGMHIKYQVQVQNIGWMDWVQDGQIAGTTGNGLRVEAAKIVLEGMSGYHVQYQAQVQNIGWMPWVQDGGIAGTAGKGLRLEALKIQIVKDGPASVNAQNYITAPSNGTSYLNNQNASLTGYTINQYGCKEVDLYIDDGFAGKASITNVVGNKSEYSFLIPLNKMSDGNHTIYVQAIGNDQTLSNQPVSFTLHALQPGICIDTPADGTFIKSGTTQLKVAGWSLNAFGVKKVQIYLDNQYKCDADIGIARPDVNASFPNYINGANCGYSKVLDMTSISNGVHTINVYSTGNDGVVTASGVVRIYKFYNDNQFITNYNLSLQQMVDKQMSDGEAVADVNGNWITADRNSVQYYVDPLNFMDSYGIYQFLRLDYIQGISADDLNSILAGKGVLDGKGTVFLDAAKQSNINPVYLVAHAMLETGNGTSKLATGLLKVNDTPIYNMFGIHAYDSNADYYGSQYAYSQGWTSVDKAIYGGAEWISGWYINNGSYKQNTLYKMRWNPASPANHQYATDIRWAYNQVYNIKRLMNKCQNANLQFDIPQYK